MSFYDTLSYIDASGDTQEIALKLANVAAYGAVTAVFTPRSHAPGTFEITWPQPPETGIAIPFKSRCIVYLGRSSATGAQNSFSGGSIIFQGRRTDNNKGVASGSRVQCSVTLSDAWWDLEQITFQAAWNYQSGGTAAAPTYSIFYWPEIVLFQPFPGISYSPAPVNSTITTWQQIQDIINFAAAYATGVNEVELQLAGSAEFTPVYCNWQPVSGAKCAECLNHCLRPHPGVFTEIDYSTTPPTLHLRNRANLTAVTLPYASNLSDGTMHLASEPESLDALVPDAVRIFYKVNNTFAGAPAISFVEDIYPLGAPNSLLCRDFALDITGSTTVRIECNFTSAAFDPTQLSLWQTKVNSLKSASQGGQIPNSGTGALAMLDTTINGGLAGHPDGLQVVDDTNTAIDLTKYLYYTDQDVQTWMQVGGSPALVAHANVVGFFTYNKTTGGALAVTPQVTRHSHSMRLKLTNAPSGLYVYQQVTNIGEAIPTGLAQAIYNELATLQWKWRHSMVQSSSSAATLPTIIKPGKHMMNLSGGNIAWTDMNAAVQSVSIKFFREAEAGCLVAETNIECGPVDILEPGYLVQLTNLFRLRNRAGIDAYARMTGAATSNQVDLSAEAARENSVPASADFAVHPVYAADPANPGFSNILTVDGTQGHIGLSQNNTASGAQVSSAIIPPVFRSNGAPGGTTLPAYAYFRIGWLYVDTTAFNLYICTAAGSASASVWKMIGPPAATGGGYAGTYNNANAYTAGQIVRVEVVNTFGGTKTTIGVFGCIVNVPANGTANQIPQFPEPTTGTKYWQLLAFGAQAISTCSGSGSTSIWINASNTFP